MQSGDRAAFVAIVEGLAAIKPGKPLTKEAIGIFWLAMQSWSLEDFRSAAAHLVSTLEFMPNPFHFQQLRKAGRPTAAEAWERARQACGSAIRAGRVTNNGTCGNDVIDRAVRGVGGYGVIAMSETDKLPFLERRFAEHYDSLQDAEETREALPQLTNDGQRSHLSGPTRAAELLRLGNPDDRRQHVRLENP